MNSYDLRYLGFKDWYDFNINNKKKLESILKDVKVPGVYVIRNQRFFGRLFGESDIVYIGSTDNLKRRIIKDYFEDPDETQLTNRRINSFLKHTSVSLEISWVTIESLLEKLKNQEKNILTEFENFKNKILEELNDFGKILKGLTNDENKEEDFNTFINNLNLNNIKEKLINKIKELNILTKIINGVKKLNSNKRSLRQLAGEMENILLELYEGEHGELPPLDRQGPKKIQRKKTRRI